MHGGDRSRDAASGVYTRRRILAVLLVLLLLAILVPRACQALVGSNAGTGSKGGQEGNAAGTDTDNAGASDTNAATTNADAGSKGGQEGNVAGTDTGAGSGAGANGTNAATANADKSKEASSDDSGAPFLDARAGNDHASEAGENAAPDLLALVTPVAVIEGDEGLASGDGEGSGAPVPSETGDETQAGQQPTTEPRNLLIARREAAEQPSPGEESALAPRSRRAAPSAFEPASTPRTARFHERRDRIRATPVVVPAAVSEAGVPQTTVEPVATAPVAAAPVAAAPVAAAPAVTEPAVTPPAVAARPVPAAPAALQNDTSFVPNLAGGVAANPGGNTVGSAVGPAPAALPAGPRLSAPGPAAARPALPARPAALPAGPRLSAPAPTAARPAVF
jgi:hypothetical protein